jgi:uncharacterized protein (DUF885 family)
VKSTSLHRIILSLIVVGSSTTWAETESDRLNAFFEESFQRILEVSPMYQSYLGIKTDYDTFDDISEEAVTREFAISVGDLARMRTDFDFEKLDDQAKISYRLFEEQIEEYVEQFPWRKHRYLATQMRGLHAQIPSFMINIHRVQTPKDAEDYVSRLVDVERLFDQLIVNLNEQADTGIIAPKFVFQAVIEACTNVIQGEPFTQSGEDSTLLADFREKVEALSPETIPAEESEQLIGEARMALLEHVEPAYGKLIETLTDLEKRATEDDGAWKFPEGDVYYRKSLQWTTTTDMSPDDIHALGVSEVDRIHDEMREIMKQVKFKGTLQDFFEFTRTDEQFYKPSTEAGKQEYLDEATAIIDAMRARLDEMFITKPEAGIIVKRVEAFREKSAGKAFYQRPAPDGSRPGTYYANLRDMADMPVYQMEALAYHEGIPGHHMQISIAQELEGLPKFRKYGGYTAYTEGWGLYSETSPKEMGMYEDPYSDFGRLAMELWRAARLVVDTGLHHKRWPRQEAIDYLLKNTPNPEGDCIHAIERYIVMPSQATAYKIGMIKIMELRARSRNALGSKFDIREFHDVVLKNGALPLDVLDEQVELWIAETK